MTDPGLPDPPDLPGGAPPAGDPGSVPERPIAPDGPLEDPDEPDRTQNDAPEALGVEHGSEKDPDPQETNDIPEPRAESDPDSD